MVALFALLAESSNLGSDFGWPKIYLLAPSSQLIAGCDFIISSQQMSQHQVKRYTGKHTVYLVQSAVGSLLASFILG